MKYLDDGRFMVPVASSAVTQEEWDQIFGTSGDILCQRCGASRVMGNGKCICAEVDKANKNRARYGLPPSKLSPGNDKA